MNNDDNFIRNSGDLSPELEARVVAWVLGEASAFEAAQLDVLCAQQPELAVFKRRLEAVHGLLGEAVKPLKTPLLLSPERRAKVLAVIGGDAPTIGSVVAAPAKARKQARSWRSWALPMAACFTMMALLSAVIIPTVGKVQQTARKSNEVSERRQLEHRVMALDLPAETSEVVNSSVSVNSPLENKASSLGSREMSVDGYAVGSLSGSATEAPTRVFFDKAMAGSGLAGSGEVVAGRSEDARVMIGLDSSAPTASSSPAVSGGGSTESSPVRLVNLGSKVVSHDMYAGPPVYLDGSSGRLNFTTSPDQTNTGVSITAGTPQEFGLVGIPAGSRKLSDSEKARLLQSAENESLNNLGMGDFDSANSSNARLESVAAEVRSRRQIRPSPAADPFAAPAAQASGEYASTRSLSEEKQDQLSVTGGDQFAGGELVAANQPIKALDEPSSLEKDSNPFLIELKKGKSLEDASKQMKEQVGTLEEVRNTWQRPGEYADTTKVSEPWDSPTQPRRKRSSITITAGTPQIFESIFFTDADRAEIARRVALRKAQRSQTELSEPSVKQGPQPVLEVGDNPIPLLGRAFGHGFSTDDAEVIAAVIAEFTKEIKALEDKADQKAKTVVDESQRTEIPTATESVSTFSLHVSDASFRLAKAALERGQAPDPATIRPEEFYNAFDYGDPSPATGEAVSCRVEQAAHPFLQQRNLVRIAMKVPAVGRGSGQPLRLTVMLDTSGSMERDDRAATVRAALTALTSLLGPDDRVTLVGFARTPTLLAEAVPGDQAAKIIELAARTPAEGGTNLEEALALAGKLAMRQKLATAQNRIVLLTDGAANLGDADPQALAKRVEALRQNGIAFDACGVVADGLDDSVLEALTRKGDGRYAVINSPEEADANFARQLAGAFRPAAKDVKVQVHFNPARVARYRLIGFEKHRLKTEDFRNDKIDAAELAAEEAAVAVYQVEVLPEGEGELGEVAVRFLDTRSNERVERSWTLAYSAQPAAFARATPSLQLAGSAAFLAEKLRGGALAGQVRLDEFATVVEGLGAAYPNAPRVREFIQMFRQTRRLTGE